jgi:signal peptidase I
MNSDSGNPPQEHVPNGDRNSEAAESEVAAREGATSADFTSEETPVEVGQEELAPGKAEPIAVRHAPVLGNHKSEVDDTETNDDGNVPGEPRQKGIFRETFTVVVTALVLSVLVRTFLVQAFYVPSGSMENTLMTNDRIVVSKISTRLTGVNRQNVVVFHDPSTWLGDIPQPNPYNTVVGRVLQVVGIVPANSGNDLVKRVIGVGGDTVECCDAAGHIIVNGKPLLNETYIKPGSRTDQVKFKVLVPEGSVFVMGDNRGNSQDSRFHLNLHQGMVPLKDVVGRVVVKIWPFDRIGGIER